jgi:hypothetical protein
MIFKIIFYNSNFKYVRFQILDMSYLVILDIVFDILDIVVL